MSIEQTYKISRVSNGYILNYDKIVPAEDDEDVESTEAVTMIFSSFQELFDEIR